MPIKFPKGFARRKSAGNVLEILENNPSQSSFRVLQREEVEDYASSGEGRAQKRGPKRPNSFPLRPYNDPALDNEGQYLSYRTHNSNSTGGASSSARHSYQSTEPSSVESSHDDMRFNDQQNAPFPTRATFDPDFFEQNKEEEQPGFAPSKMKKKFSIPRLRFGTSNSPAPRRSSETTETTRDRSHTITGPASSYASTSEPPRIELGLGQGSRGNTDVASPWFDGPGNNRRSQIMQEPSYELPEPPRPIFRSESDSLLAAKKQFSFDDSDDRPLPLSPRLQRPHRADQYAPRPVELNDSQGYSSSSVYRRSPEHWGSALRESSPTLAAMDDQLLLDAAYASQALERQLGMPLQKTSPVNRSPDIIDKPKGIISGGSREPPKSFSNRGNLVSGSPVASSPHVKSDESDSLFENSPASTVVIHRSETPSTLPRLSRVMTPAEFERAKQSAATGKDEDDKSEQSDEDDLYEDEDETERTRQLAKQRRKQEAHMTVYRQQMMKVTGEQPTDLAERPKMSRLSQSMPSIAPIFSSTSGRIGLEGEQSGKSSDDSDDEVPLGVLQAHGFPSKSRPPTRMADHLNRASSSYPAPPGSTRNDASAGGGGSGTLPPFARNLPVDPYVGASLVNQANRESLSYNSSSAPTTPSTSLPPGGLVGVIVGEERARAMRRGSPNTNGVYGAGQAQQQMMNPMHNHPLSAAEQTQTEMSNQMTQMMQMQMQWMQQMIQMQAFSQQIGTPMPHMPHMPQMPFMGNQMPQTQYGAQQAEYLDPQAFQGQQPGSFHQRSRSSMSGYLHGVPSPPSSFGVMPSASMEGMQARYAPSLAPSERNNVGQPSRYRPVTPNTTSTRTSTLSHGTGPAALPSNYGMLDNPRARSPVKSQTFAEPRNPYASKDASNMPPTIRAVSRPKKGSGGGTDGSDDEDAAGWEEMKRKREARKSRWRPRRTTFMASQAPNGETPGLEALYYDGSLE